MAGTVAATGLTDSQVSASVITRGLTTSYPLCTVSMELATQLEARNAQLFLEWVPREANAEADRLADGVVKGFSPELRVKASLSQIRSLVLPGLLDAGATFLRKAAKMSSRAG